MREVPLVVKAVWVQFRHQFKAASTQGGVVIVSPREEATLPELCRGADEACHRVVPGRQPIVVRVVAPEQRRDTNPPSEVVASLEAI